MTQQQNLRALAIAAASLLAVGAAQATNFSRGVYSGAKDDIKTTYKAERDTCNNLAGNAKDICVETAKGREAVAMAQLEFNYSGKTGDESKVYKARYEAAYNVAKEKCDDLGGNAKDVCVKEAQAARDKAKADLKLANKVNDAAGTAVAEHVKADYKVAREKCDALSGDPKNICVASAKARYDERW